jgi:hypothetical protein
LEAVARLLLISSAASSKPNASACSAKRSAFCSLVWATVPETTLPELPRSGPESWAGKVAVLYLIKGRVEDEYTTKLDPRMTLSGTVISAENVVET